MPFVPAPNTDKPATSFEVVLASLYPLSVYFVGSGGQTRRGFKWSRFLFALSSDDDSLRAALKLPVDRDSLL